MENLLNEVFTAFHGGYGGPSYYFYINKMKTGYQFRYGYDKSGRLLFNTTDEVNLYNSIHSKEYYDAFINCLQKLTTNWKEKYDNSDILDGTQWHIVFQKINKKYSGSNDFPENYEKVLQIIKEFFNVRVDIEKIRDDEFLNLLENLLKENTETDEVNKNGETKEASGLGEIEENKEITSLDDFFKQ